MNCINQVKDHVNILITGDFCPVNRTGNLAMSKNIDLVFNDFVDVLQGNDLNIINLECPLTSTNEARLKTGPHQKSSPECIEILKYGRINVATMANNHIMDYGSIGAQETIDLCEQNGIATIGIGDSPGTAAAPYLVTIRERHLAIFNYADNEFITSSDGQMHANVIDPVRCFSEIRSIRDQVDFVLVIIHGGNEFYELPSPRTKILYRYFIEIGADAVVAHHTHAFSGFEVYRSKPIFYGLGNFIYDWPGKINSRWNHGYCVRLRISDSAEFELIPLKQSNERPGIFHLGAEESLRFNKEIERLNSIIQDDSMLESEFQKYCESVFPMYDAFLEPYFGTVITALRKRGFFPKFLSQRKRRLYLNIIRCESHREVILRLLEKTV